MVVIHQIFPFFFRCVESFKIEVPEMRTGADDAEAEASRHAAAARMIAKDTDTLIVFASTVS